MYGTSLGGNVDTLPSPRVSITSITAIVRVSITFQLHDIHVHLAITCDHMQHLYNVASFNNT